MVVHGEKTRKFIVPAERLCLRGLEVSGHRLHKSGDNPLPCQKKAVILHSHSALESQWLIAALLNQRATKASALPKNPRFSGTPRKMHR